MYILYYKHLYTYIYPCCFRFKKHIIIVSSLAGNKTKAMPSHAVGLSYSPHRKPVSSLGFSTPSSEVSPQGVADQLEVGLKLRLYKGYNPSYPCVRPFGGVITPHGWRNNHLPIYKAIFGGGPIYPCINIGSWPAGDIQLPPKKNHMRNVKKQTLMAHKYSITCQKCSMYGIFTYIDYKPKP